MYLGFTGTSKGMTKKQDQAVRAVFRAIHVDTLHHGDCVGADEQAHAIAKRAGCRIVVHPPDNDYKRAYTCTLPLEMENRPSVVGTLIDEKQGITVWPERPYLQRNKDIVGSSDIVLACPGTFKEELRSGTWSTVRYAEKMGVRVWVIWPNGEIEYGG